MNHNLTGASVEVILADRSRVRIPVEELFEHFVTIAVSTPVDSLFTPGRSFEDSGQVVEALGVKQPVHPLSDEAEAASRANLIDHLANALDDQAEALESNKLMVTSDFVEAVAKASDGKQAASNAVATVAKALDEQAKAPVAKKVAAKSAGKKAGEGDSA